MLEQEMVQNEDGTISVVETKSVPVETYDKEAVLLEYDSVKSELENWDAVTANRHAYLTERLAKLEQIKQFMEQSE